jgi:hypothetical protein
METSGTMKIKPMGIMSSLLFFGIPSAVCSFSIYFVMQKLHRNGIITHMAFNSVPLVGLIIGIIG